MMDGPKSLVMANNMEEHRKLFLNTSIDVVLNQKTLCLKRLQREKKGALVILSIAKHYVS
jgi:hypothetical protein